MKRALIALVIAAGASSVEATTSGTVTGCVTYRDMRRQGNVTGDPHALHINRTALGEVAFPSALVRLVNAVGSPLGKSQTGADGCFSFTWFDAIGASFPSHGYKLRVYLQNENDWYLTDETGRRLIHAFNVVVRSANHDLGSVSMGRAEEALVFQTAADYWDRIVNKSNVLSDRMTKIRISTNVSWNGSPTGCPEDTSCTLNADHVSLIDGRGQTRPATTVAHELGHATVAHAMNLASMPNAPFCTSEHDMTDTMNCDRTAYSEGFADFMGGVFKWTANATSPTFNGSGLEVPDSVCSESDEPWRVEACFMAALWDVYDDPAGDDDRIDGNNTPVNIASIVNVLNHYPDGCPPFFDDRCSNEGGPNGPNHWDFLKNFSDVFPELESEGRDIYDAAMISGGGDEPF